MEDYLTSDVITNLLYFCEKNKIRLIFDEFGIKLERESRDHLYYCRRYIYSDLKQYKDSADMIEKFNDEADDWFRKKRNKEDV